MNDKMLPTASEGTAMTLEKEPKSNPLEIHDSPQDDKAHYQNIYDGLMRGYESFLTGKITSAEDADAHIRKTKGWGQAVYDMAHSIRHAPRGLDINWFE